MTLKLFVADDSVTIRKVIGLAFNESDTVIESVTSGDSALDAIRAFQPDIVLADVCMPGINGYEICARIKDDPDLARIPVVLLVGTFETFDVSEAARARFDASLTKPFDTFELVGIVKKLVGGDTMLQEKESETAVPSVDSEAASASFFGKQKAFGTGIPVSRQALNSFLGSDRILDVFDEASMADVERRMRARSVTHGSDAASSYRTGSQTLTADQLPEDVLDGIVERVVRKMSADVISEIAWEIVPELSEILIRRSIEDGKES